MRLVGGCATHKARPVQKMGNAQDLIDCFALISTPYQQSDNRGGHQVGHGAGDHRAKPQLG
jgi:hypothetical protein